MNVVLRLLELTLSLCGRVVAGWGGGLHSHFHIQPNYSGEVALCCRWVCDNNISQYNAFQNFTPF